MLELPDVFYIVEITNQNHRTLDKKWFEDEQTALKYAKNTICKLRRASEPMRSIYSDTYRKTKHSPKES